MERNVRRGLGRGGVAIPAVIALVVGQALRTGRSNPKERGVTVRPCEHCERDGLLGAKQTQSATAGRSSNYWIIKAKPERNDFTKFPLRGEPGRWYTSRPPKAWLPGDTLFIWAGSPILRVIGRARLTEPDAGLDHNLYHFGVEYATNLIEGPTIKDLRRDPLLRDASFLKSGPSRTVFPLTPEQGTRMLQLLAPFKRSSGRGRQLRL